MKIPLSSAGYPPRSAQRRVFYQELLTRINALPGVKAAAVGPLPVWMGVSKPPEVGIQGNVVSVDYFRAMGMRLRAGRGFTEWDNENAPPVVVINETLARLDFAGKDPIGERVTYGFDGPRRIYGTIVGVVADVKRFGVEAHAPPQEYHSVLQKASWGDLDLVIRAAGDPMKLAPAVRQQVWAIDANMPVVGVMSMEHRLTESVAPRRFQMFLFGLFSVVALVLAAVGVYGVISHSVSRRMREIGIRMALGARPRDALLMVIRQGMSLALIGMAIGLAAGLALARVMASLLFNVKATDPATFAGVSLLLVSVAILAAYIPARRATKVDPMIALKHE
jgi:predicted permease